MVKMNRFIQFNDETVDAKTLLLYERLGRALADAPFLDLTERKLLEFRPKEGISLHECLLASSYRRSYA